MKCWSRWVFAAVTGLATTLHATDAWSCTTFLARHGGQAVVGKGYDWDQGAGLVVTNARGVAKKALLLDASTPATWTSRYGSVTFNQFGAELPNGGMNEAGLVVELMWLTETEYPAADERPAMTEVQWIQHALDRFATVDELVASAATIRIASAYADVHYLACDATGECAAFEYLDGALVVTTGNDLVVPTLANDSYADAAAYLALHTGFGGTREVPSSESSLDRFVRASALARETEGGELPAAAFGILDSVSQGTFTQWNSVYATADRTIHWRTQKSPAIKVLDLDDLDLDCTAPRLALDLDATLEGDVVTRLVPYTTELNRALLDVTLADIGLPPIVVALAAAYPESLTCDPNGTPKGTGGHNGGDADGGSASDGGCGFAVGRPRAGEWMGLVLIAAVVALGRRRACSAAGSSSRMPG